MHAASTGPAEVLAGSGGIILTTCLPRIKVCGDRGACAFHRTGQRLVFEPEGIESKRHRTFRQQGNEKRGWESANLDGLPSLK